MSEPLKAALREIKQAMIEDTSPVIYLHDPDDGQPFGLLIVEPPRGEDRPLNEAAEKAMEEKGWEPMHHSHIDGDE